MLFVVAVVIVVLVIITTITTIPRPFRDGLGMSSHDIPFSGHVADTVLEFMCRTVAGQPKKGSLPVRYARLDFPEPGKAPRQSPSRQTWVCVFRHSGLPR